MGAIRCRIHRVSISFSAENWFQNPTWQHRFAELHCHYANDHGTECHARLKIATLPKFDVQIVAPATALSMLLAFLHGIYVATVHSIVSTELKQEFI